MKRLIDTFSLRGRIWLMAMGIWMIVAIISLVDFFAHRNTLENLFWHKANTVIQTVAVNLENGEWQDGFLQQALAAGENAPDVAFLYVEDSTTAAVYELHTEKYTGQLQTFLQNNDMQQRSENLLLIKHPLFFNEVPGGTVIAGFNTQWINARQTERINTTLMIVGGFSLFLFIFTFLMARYVTEPISWATRKINRYREGKGKSYVRLADGGNGDIFELGRAFNHLADNIDEQMESATQYQNYLEAFFSLSPTPLLITDTVGNIEKANHNASMLFEIEPERLLNSNLQALVGPGNFNVIKNQINESGSDIKGYVGVLPSSSGDQKIVEINLSLLYNSQRVLQNYIISIVNITDNIQTQHEILASQINRAKLDREIQETFLKTREENKRLNTIIQLNQETIEQDSAGKILDMLVSHGKDLIDARECIVFIWEKNQRALIPAKTSPSTKLKQLKTIQSSDGLIWRTFRENQPFIWKNSALEALDYEELGLDTAGKYDLYTAPIGVEEFQYGVIVYIQHAPKAFSVDDLQVIARFARQAGMALNKFFLSQKMKDRNDSLRRLNGELHKTRQKAIKLEKMANLGRLIGGVAHDFNNIIGIIKPNVDLLKMGTANYPDLQKRILIIKDAVDNATGLIRQLFMASRNQQEERISVQPSEFIEQVLEMFRRLMGKKITVETELGENIPRIIADPVQLQQVLMNLAINARDAIAKSGTITFMTSLENYAPADSEAPPKPYVRISVQDTGGGISRQNMRRIFEPFFTTKETGKGTGLGLSIVMDIVKSHNGFIDIDTKLGRGTTFHIYIPPAPMPKKKSKPGATVLVVDDEALFRESLQDSLKSLGYHVYQAADGEAALRRIKEKKKIDLAIVDLTMPQLNGIATIRSIQEIAPDIRILLSSGYNDKENLIHEHVNIHGFLPKPYNLEELEDIVKQALSAKQSEPSSS